MLVVAPRLANVESVIDGVPNVGPQSPVNVTNGYNTGTFVTDAVPLTTTTTMTQNGLCPVTVQWTLGAEHLSVGQYDPDGSGPSTALDDNNSDLHQCSLYDETDPGFTTPYNWQYCLDMQVGQTYELQWPHSAVGACGTVFQYQTTNYLDGVFCRIEDLDIATPGATALQIAIQAQVFTIINDEEYYYPDLLRGMIVTGDYGQDVVAYVGSTTASSVLANNNNNNNNNLCSQYSPISWHVDRQCRLISASSMDKLCADLLQQPSSSSDVDFCF